MKGHTSGVQARLLKENSRAFFVPCTCHNYNLFLGDVAKCCPDAITFFGILQAIYTLFSALTKRWAVFKKYVPGLSVKPLSITRWECRNDSVKAIRYQVGEVYDASVEISEIANEPMVKAEAESLANQLKDYKFCASLIFWYEVLFNDVLISANELAESTKLPPESRKFHEKKYVKGSECFYMRQMSNLMMIQKKRTEFIASTSPRSSYSVIGKQI